MRWRLCFRNLVSVSGCYVYYVLCMNVLGMLDAYVSTRRVHAALLLCHVVHSVQFGNFF